MNGSKSGGARPWARVAAFLWLLAAALPLRAFAECDLLAGSHARWYEHDAQRGYQSLGSVTGEASCNYRSGAHTVSATVFGRLAQHDSARSHIDVREMLWTAAGERVQTRIGVNRVFWGVMEFSHVVDVLNQADVLEDPFGEVKLGQPMINVGLTQGWGALNAFALPYFRRREFPDFGEPLRAAPPVQIAAPAFESEQGRNHWDFALRYSLTRGPLDLGLTYFDGTARDPLFIDLRPSAAGFVMTPYYALIEQTSVDVQLTLGDWSIKFEGAHRNRRGASAQAYAGGVEYLLSGVAGAAADLIFAAEYVRDDRDPPPVPGFLDDDWSVGVRLAMNDARASVGKFGLISDRRRRSQAWALEFASRASDHWRWACEARWFNRVAERDPLRAIRGDSYIDFSLTRYF